MNSLKMILVTPSAAPGEYYYLAYEELIPRQLYGNEKEGSPGEYFRIYDRDFEFEVIKKYAVIVTRSKVPIQEEGEESIGLILGCLGRVAAFGNFIIFLMAAFVHGSNGWTMNWTGKKKGEGIEYFILLLSMLLVIILNGSGQWSVDYWLYHHKF